MIQLVENEIRLMIKFLSHLHLRGPQTGTQGIRLEQTETSIFIKCNCGAMQDITDYTKSIPDATGNDSEL